MKQKICKREGCNNKLTGRQTIWCSPNCYQKYIYKTDEKRREKSKNSQISVPTFATKKSQSVYTNGVTKEIKDSNFVQKETERILKDCIKNPAKYLKDDIDD